MNYINMLNVNNLGVGNSFFHKYNPVVKFLFVMFNYILMFTLNFNLLQIYILFLGILLLVFCLKFKDFLKVLLFLLIPLSGFILCIILLNFPNKVYLTYVIFIKIVSMILPLLFYSLTTPIKESNYVIYKVLQPFEYIGINTSAVNLTLSLIITYIPFLLQELDNILLIKASKGEDIKEVRVYKKVVILYQSLFPLITNSFSKGDKLIDAILVRNFSFKQKRSFYISYEMYLKDWISIVVLFGLISLYILYKIF